MSKDFLNWARLQNENTSIEFCRQIYNQSLRDLSSRVQAFYNTLTNYGMPDLDERMKILHGIYYVTNYDAHSLDQFINEIEPRLVDDKRKSYHRILNSTENDKEITVRYSDIPHNFPAWTLLDTIYSDWLD